MLDSTVGFSLLVTTFESFPFIVVFLSLTYCDDEFDESACREESRRDDGKAFFFARLQCVDLLAVREEFAWLGVDGSCARLALLVELQAEAGALQP